MAFSPFEVSSFSSTVHELVTTIVSSFSLARFYTGEVGLVAGLLVILAELEIPSAASEVEVLDDVLAVVGVVSEGETVEEVVVEDTSFVSKLGLSGRTVLYGIYVILSVCSVSPVVVVETVDSRSVGHADSLLESVGEYGVVGVVRSKCNLDREYIVLNFPSVRSNCGVVRNDSADFVGRKSPLDHSCVTVNIAVEYHVSIFSFSV